MSSYINFYLRVNDSFAPIRSYSRSSSLYQAMQHQVPYEGICALTSHDLSDVVRSLKESAARVIATKEKDKRKCDYIMNAANTSLDEKLEAIHEIESNFEEMDAYIEEIKFAVGTLRVFLNMIDDFRYSEVCFSNDYNHYIYAGIDSFGSLENVIKE